MELSGRREWGLLGVCGGKKKLWKRVEGGRFWIGLGMGWWVKEEMESEE